jgi:hypothetical protein
MGWSLGSRALRAAARVAARPGLVAATACTLALAACNQNGPTVTAGQPRGATVAFESIDGPPPRQFQTLVKDLNEQAQTRRLAVISREQSSAYRVRGYLAAKVIKDHTTISWVWDVFDGEERRALRISGEETAKGRHREAWSAADDAMMQRIARASMEQLAAFLPSPEVAPGSGHYSGGAPVALGAGLPGRGVACRQAPAAPASPITVVTHGVQGEWTIVQSADLRADDLAVGTVTTKVNETTSSGRFGPGGGMIPMGPPPGR